MESLFVVRSASSRKFYFTIPSCLAAAIVLVVSMFWRSPALGDQIQDIHDAVVKGDLAMVTALLKANTELAFSKDNNGETPLHLAADKCHRDVAEVLLAAKGDVNA